MVNDKMRLQKAEHDVWLAQLQALKNSANIEYLAMMSDIEIDDEGEEEINMEEDEE